MIKSHAKNYFLIDKCRNIMNLQKLRENDSKGFTLIELMIVIAIIGILAIIAIPNFVSYRDKVFCSAAESDANNIAAAISDYYSIPNRVNMVDPNPATPAPAGLGMTLSGNNTATIGGTLQQITISVTDASGRCPADYQASQQPEWNGANVFTIDM
jgi:prepilin-type N-terminal cleavage/methylation domain-containing protein